MTADDATRLCAGAREMPVLGHRGGERFEARDWVAEEVPIALEYNGIAHAVMLATPLDLADFALGFSLGEGLLEGPHELYGIEEERSAAGITLQLDVASAAFARLKSRRRTLAGRTGCGLCGTESLGAVRRVLRPLPAPPPAFVTRTTGPAGTGGFAGAEGSFRCTDAPGPADPSGQRFARQAVDRALAQTAALQSLQQATGAVHAAAWCHADGSVARLREDVGRHNALDKLVGALAAERVDAAAGFIVVTSRASFEMVQKTVSAGVCLLAAVSAPTALAIDVAEAANLTLVGFARGADLVVYSGAGRVVF